LKLKLLIFWALALVSILPIGILGYWQFSVTVDNKLNFSDDQQLINYITAFSDNFSTAALMTGALGIIIAFVVSWWLADIIGRPLGNFENTARSVSEGGFSTKYLHSTSFEPGEIRDLSNALSLMVSQLEKNNTDLHYARELAENTNQARSNFLSSMNHELRTPLISILGFSELLNHNKNVPLTTEQESHVNNIITSGHHLMKLIDQILDLSRFDSGNLGPKLDAVNPAKVIPECIKITEAAAKKRSISVANNIVIKNMPIVRADATQLKQVILCLLSNAVKHSQVGGTVTINTAVTTNQMLRINISDTGPGISGLDSKNIFVPNERIAEQSGNLEVTGIGLPISKQLIESMNGSIGFESEIGKGSTFWISLPIKIGVEQQEAKFIEPDSQPQPVEMPASTGKMKRVLYIEDNPLNTKLMELLFSSVPNATLATAMTGEEGVKLANEISPDLILMDIFLPGIDGIEAARLLKDPSKTSNIPIIAISAATWDVDVERARDVGFFAYLTKPINIPEALNTIQKALEQNH
jgi:signal transduction histidine kinase/CheY-like chemotaxis protein